MQYTICTQMKLLMEGFMEWFDSGSINGYVTLDCPHRTALCNATFSLQTMNPCHGWCIWQQPLCNMTLLVNESNLNHIQEAVNDV